MGFVSDGAARSLNMTGTRQHAVNLLVKSDSSNPHITLSGRGATVTVASEERRWWRWKEGVEEVLTGGTAAHSVFVRNTATYDTSLDNFFSPPLHHLASLFKPTEGLCVNLLLNNLHGKQTHTHAVRECSKQVGGRGDNPLGISFGDTAAVCECVSVCEYNAVACDSCV